MPYVSAAAKLIGDQFAHRQQPYLVEINRPYDDISKAIFRHMKFGIVITELRQA
jgi:hypothetical protein